MNSPGGDETTPLLERERRPGRSNDGPLVYLERFPRRMVEVCYGYSLSVVITAVLGAVTTGGVVSFPSVVYIFPILVAQIWLVVELIVAYKCMGRAMQGGNSPPRRRGRQSRPTPSRTRVEERGESRGRRRESQSRSRKPVSPRIRIIGLVRLWYKLWAALVLAALVLGTFEGLLMARILGTPSSQLKTSVVISPLLAGLALSVFFAVVIRNLGKTKVSLLGLTILFLSLLSAKLDATEKHQEERKSYKPVASYSWLVVFIPVWIGAGVFLTTYTRILWGRRISRVLELTAAQEAASVAVVVGTAILVLCSALLCHLLVGGWLVWNGGSLVNVSSATLTATLLLAATGGATIACGIRQVFLERVAALVETGVPDSIPLPVSYSNESHGWVADEGALKYLSVFLLGTVRQRQAIHGEDVRFNEEGMQGNRYAGEVLPSWKNSSDASPT